MSARSAPARNFLRAGLPSQHLCGSGLLAANRDGLAAVEELRRRGVDMPMILITTNPLERTRRLSALAGIPIVETPELGARLTEAIHKAIGGAPPPAPA